MKKLFFAIFFIIQISFQIAKAQWVQQNSGTNQNLYDIEFINDKTGWAVGDAGVVIKTIDGGMNWINIPNPTPSISPNLWSVEPIDSNIVYVTSSGDFIMKSTNGGTNWNILHSCPECNSSFIGINFLNKDTGWVLGSYKVFRTFNGGISFDSFYVPWFDNFDIYFKDINTGIFCGTGKVFKTTDRGENWFDTEVVNPGLFPMFRKLGVANNNIWVGGGNPSIFKSTDFGESWSICDSSIGAFGISFVNELTGFIGGGGNTLFKTTNGGSNFYRERTDSTSLAFISSIDFVSDSIGWYSCAVGRIYKTITSGQVLTNIASQNIEQINSFMLQQNYPNPFNPQTKIKFTILTSEFTSLKVYNISGKEISNLLNSKIQAGSYEVVFDGSDLPSGVYYYKIEAGSPREAGYFQQVKKMVLIK